MSRLLWFFSVWISLTLPVSISAIPLEFIFQPQRPPLQQYVMMPLEPITDWDGFQRGLRNLKKIGVKGVTTDICWGLVEKRKGLFDWEYYKKLGHVLQAEGIGWVHILSTHAIGGNVGDTVDIAIPKYVWSEVRGAEYVYRDQRRNREVISYFAEDLAYFQAVIPFYRSWRKELFEPFHAIIPKVYVGLGPASEARFPSYVPALGFVYPGEGELPIYSKAAIQNFRSFLVRRYEGSIERLNAAWGTSLQRFDGKMDGTQGPIPPQESTAEFLMNARSSRYFLDLMDWYQGVLLHGIDRGLKAVSQALSRNPNLPLGDRFSIKIAGLHWQRLNPATPRATEYAAGYASYDPVFAMAKKWGVGVTFTCLEMLGKQKGYPEYSDPEGMIAQVLESAAAHQVPVSGENALAIHSEEPFHTVRELVEKQGPKSAFHAFTTLRWNTLIHPSGEPTELAGAYSAILAKPAPLQILYQAPQAQRKLIESGVQYYLVPIDPLSLKWLWKDKVPLTAQSEHSNELRGQWNVVDPEAQYFGIGATQGPEQVQVQMTFPQPKGTFRDYAGYLVLSWMQSPVPKAPTAETAGEPWKEGVLGAAIAACAQLLRFPDHPPKDDVRTYFSWIERLLALESGE